MHNLILQHGLTGQHAGLERPGGYLCRFVRRLAGCSHLLAYHGLIGKPSQYGGDLFAGAADAVRKLRTAGGVFAIPTEITEPRETLGRYTDILETCIRTHYTPEEFVAQCEDNGLPVADAEAHRALYVQLQTLHTENKNGIWARIIKNAFAPLFIGEVDIIAGNPPWVNWESLPGDYRDETKYLWKQYGLFTLSGSAARLGGGKKDLSMLFVYAATDCYLKAGGKLGYVITQSLFKTKGAGDGFRQFRFAAKDHTVLVNPLKVHDLGSMQVFDGASNHTAIFIAQKRIEQDKAAARNAVAYPVPYTLWRGPGRVPQETELADFRKMASCRELGAVPVEPAKSNSAWLTAPAAAFLGINKVIGKSAYKASAGATNWLNGVYWIHIFDKLPNGNLLIQNLHDVGKIKVDSVQAAVEPDLIYPLLRGRDVQAWDARPSLQILVAQNPVERAGIAEAEMKRKYPKTFAYLKQFETQLRDRSGFKKYFEDADPFYSMYNVGPDTLAPCKVVWKDMGSFIQVAVAGKQDDRVVCPEHHVMAVSLDDEAEANYLCAALMSSPAQMVVACYTTTTGISTHVLQNVAIPRYKPDDGTHRTLSALSEKCHAAASVGDMAAVAVLESEIDAAAALLWNITPEELAAIHEALAEMKNKSRVFSPNDCDDAPELVLEV